MSKAENDDVEFEEEQEDNEAELIEDDEDGDDSEDDESIDDDEEDDESSSDSENEVNNANKLDDAEYGKRFSELERLINQNQYQYQYYVDIIKLTRDNEKFDKLKSYREKMSEIFPLTENLWLEWLKDEQKFIQSDSDRPRVKELFEKAINDYLSIDIWLEYIYFSIGGMAEPNGTQNIRSVCDRAISFAGFHVTKGYSLWDAYIQFELAVLGGYQQTSAGAIQTKEQEQKISDQIMKILRLYKAELSVCLDNTEKTKEELKQFDETQIDESLLKTCERTLKKYKAIDLFEKTLKTAEDPVKKLEAYKIYLEFELKLVRELEKNKQNNKNKSKQDKAEANSNGHMNIYENDELHHQRTRLKVLFERVIAEDSNCLDASIWIKYIFYLNEEEANDPHAFDKEFYLNILKRSIRNCPWSSKLWISYALMLEKTHESADTVKGVYNNAMNSGLQTSDDYLQIWHSYLDFLRRSLVPYDENLDDMLKTKRETQIEELRDSFRKAIEQLFEYFKNDGDPLLSLEKYWCLVEAKYLKNMEKARKIFNEMIITRGSLSKYAHDWVEFYEIEKVYGDEKHQRKLLNRAVNEVVESNEKEVIYDLLYKFEKLNGNAHQFNSVYTKYEQFKEMRQLELISKKQFDISKNFVKKEQSQQKGKPDAKAKKEEKKAPVQQSSTLKRKKSDTEVTEKTAEKIDSDGFLIPSLPTSSSSNEQASKKLKNEPAPPAPSNLADIKKFSNSTVFISNLSYEVDEAQIRKVFEKQPGFKAVRIVKHWSGKNKGYGYIDFETDEQAANALKLDRTPVGGRPVFISPNEDKSLDFGQSRFKYSTTLEKRKLFISGLPFETDKAALEEIFKTFGKLKEVRIVTYKNGKSKGLAYVEFEDEQSASKALIQTDQMLIGEHQISVAISNPPRRGEKGENKDEPARSIPVATTLGSGSLTSRDQPPAKTTTPFLPRSQALGRKKTLNLN